MHERQGKLKPSSALQPAPNKKALSNVNVTARKASRQNSASIHAIFNSLQTTTTIFRHQLHSALRHSSIHRTAHHRFWLPRQCSAASTPPHRGRQPALFAPPTHLHHQQSDPRRSPPSSFSRSAAPSMHLHHQYSGQQRRPPFSISRSGAPTMPKFWTIITNLETLDRCRKAMAM